MAYMKDKSGRRLDSFKVADTGIAAWFGSGDSIMRGSGSIGNEDTEYRGFFVEACERDGYGYMFSPFFGELGKDFYPARHFRLGGTQYTTHYLDEYGQNDFGPFGNLSVATLQANALKRWQSAWDRGQVVYAITITPRTDTTTAWGTTAGQTVSANEAIRTGYNDWIRAGAPCLVTAGYPSASTVGTPGVVVAGEEGHPLTGYFETADSVESSRNSGKWNAATRAVTDAAMTSASNVLTSATAAFVAGDVGKLVNVAGAGGAGATLTVTIQSVTNATTAVLTNTASTTVSDAALAIDPYTIDGVHPSQRGHLAMAGATTLADAVTDNPPRVARDWTPIAFRPNGHNGGFATGRQGGTSRIKHTIVPGEGYSQIRLAYSNYVGPYPGPNALKVGGSIEYTSKVYPATFGNVRLGELAPGQPILLSDPINIDIRSGSAGDFLFSRSFVDSGAFTVDAATDTIATSYVHGLSIGDTVAFPATVGNVTTGTVFYVKTVPSSTSMTISTTNGGATLDLTTSGTGYGQYPKGLAMRGANGDGDNFSAGPTQTNLVGTTLGATAPANPSTNTTGQTFSPAAILGRVAR